MRTCLFTLVFFTAQMLQAQTWYIHFPADTLLVDYCNFSPAGSGAPVFYNPDSLPLVATYEDEVFGITPVCFTITRNWLVYNADTYNPAAPSTYVPNPGSYWAYNDTLNSIGPIVSPIDTPGDPWSATLIKILPIDTAETNFSIFWDSTTNAYRYKQLIHIIDTLPPEILACPADTLVFADTTANDSLFWNETYWTGLNWPGHDLQECPVELAIEGSDACSGYNVGASFLLFLDLDRNGSQETVVRWASIGSPYGTVQYNNVNTPNYNGGEIRYFDQRPTLNKYVFDFEKVIAGDHAVFHLRWRTGAYPYTYVTPQLPPGTHRIRWSVSDGCGQETTCEYTFTVNGGPLPPGGFQNVYIHFPDDVYVTDCNGNFDFDQPELYNPDSLPVSSYYTIESITPVPDACYIIEKQWTVYNDSLYDPLLPCLTVPNPTPKPIATHPDNLPGPIVSPQGTSFPWAPTVTNVSPSAPEPSNYSQYWGPYANCYLYTQHIRVLDTEAPSISDCGATLVVVPDSSDNDPGLWNAPYWLDPQTGNHDLREGALDLEIDATDSCNNFGIELACLLFLDLDQDGTLESVLNSSNPPPPGMIRYNNANTPGGTGGELRQFDQRGLPESESWRFVFPGSVDATQKNIRLRWNTQANPNQYFLPQLPPGAHQVKWIANDNCGNQTVCEHPIHIEPLVSATQMPPDGSRAPMLFAPAPNPFSEQCVIAFFLPAPGAAQFRVSDLSGRELFEKNGVWPGGRQQFILNKSDLGDATGVLVVQMTCEGRVLTQKLVLN